MKNNSTILVIILLVLNQIFKKFISKMDCYNYNWLLGSLSIIFGFFAIKPWKASTNFFWLIANLFRLLVILKNGTNWWYSTGN